MKTNNPNFETHVFDARILVVPDDHKLDLFSLLEAPEDAWRVEEDVGVGGGRLMLR